MGNPIWTVDGKAFPRNPDNYEIKWDKGNVSYEPQADGSELRVQSPKLMRGGDFTLSWNYADRRTIRFVSQFFNQAYPLPGQSHTIVVDGIQPALKINGWFDTPNAKMSKDIYTSKIGEGGTRHDFTASLRINGRGFVSQNTVPSASSTPGSSMIAVYSRAQIGAWFGGPIGNSLDNLPAWSGYGWNVVFASNSNFSVPNLGNQEWWPTIRINGPFATFYMAELWADVDGSGQGVLFSWTGSALAAGSYLLFQTQQLRCWTVVGGVKTEVYTFSVTTPSDSNPFPYWPGMLPGDNPLGITSSGMTGSSSVDFSNAGTESFPYWF